jgi:twinkle protein
MEVKSYPSHKELCPKCSHNRRNANKTEKCLTVWDNGYSKCHNCGDEGFANGSQSPPSDTASKEYTKPSQELPEGLPPQVIDYFEKRGINYDVLMRNKISYDPQYGDIIFPYIVGGEILNKKYRKLSEKRFRQEKNARKSFYGTDDIIGETDVYIVEGEIDKLSFEMAGFINVVSVPDGAPNETAKELTKKLNYIDDWKHLFEDTRRIIIAVDSDGPGQKLQEELIDRLGSDKCYTIVWPLDCKDANDVLMAHGVGGIWDCIDHARPLPIAGVTWPGDLVDKYKTLYKEGLKPGDSTGWLNLDQHYTVKPGQLTVITGIPSHGKSSFLTAMIINLAKSKDNNYVFYSPENYPMERYLASMASIYSGKPFRKGVTQRMTEQEALTINEWLNQHFCFLEPDEAHLDLNSLLHITLQIAKRQKVDGLILDPWNEVKHNMPNGMTETVYVSNCLGTIRAFIRETGMHVFIVAHPTKLPRQDNGKTPLAPGAYDISGSANWANKADNILSVWRDPQANDDITQVQIQKVRFPEIGKSGGMATFKHEVMTGRFNPLTTPARTVAQETPRKKAAETKNEHWQQQL